MSIMDVDIELGFGEPCRYQVPSKPGLTNGLRSFTHVPGGTAGTDNSVEMRLHHVQIKIQPVDEALCDKPVTHLDQL